MIDYHRYIRLSSLVDYVVGGGVVYDLNNDIISNLQRRLNRV